MKPKIWFKTACKLWPKVNFMVRAIRINYHSIAIYFIEQDFSLQEWQVKFMHLQARIKLNCASKEEAIEHLEKVYEQFLR